MRNQFDNIGMNKIATDCNNSQRSVQQIDPISTIKNILQKGIISCNWAKLLCHPVYVVVLGNLSSHVGHSDKNNTVSISFDSAGYAEGIAANKICLVTFNYLFTTSQQTKQLRAVRKSILSYRFLSTTPS